MVSHHKQPANPEEAVAKRARDDEYRRRYRIKNAERIKEMARVWAKANPDKMLESCRKFNRENAESRRAYQQARRDANPELHRARTKATRLKYPEKTRALSARYRARRNGADGVYTADDIERIYKAQSGKCAYCTKRLGQNYHVDHIIPLARGGSNYPRNLQVVCLTCNSSKKDRDPLAFAQKIGKLL